MGKVLLTIRMRALFVLPLAAGLGVATAHGQIVIDDFSTDSAILGLNSTPPNTVTAFNDGAGILQTERNLRVSALTIGAGGDISVQVSGGAMSFNRTANVTNGSIDLWWDGNNDTDVFAGSGLGGVDLTAGGQDRIRVTVASSSSASLQWRLNVYTSPSDFFQQLFTLPTGGGTVDLLYSGFSVGGGSPSFSNVGAVFLAIVDANGVWSGSITDIRTTPVELLRFSID